MGLIDGRVNRTGTHHVYTNLAILQIQSPRTCERSNRGLGGAVNTEGGHSVARNHGSVQNDGTTVPKQGQRLLYAEDQAFDIDSEYPVEVLLGDRSQRRVFADSSVGEQNVDVAFLLLHNTIKPVQIAQFRRVALNTGRVFAKQLHGSVQFTLPAAGYKDVGSFGDEPLSCRQPDAAAASGNHCHLTFKFLHERLDAAGGTKMRSFLGPARLYWKSDPCSLSATASLCLPGPSRGRAKIG